MSSKVSIRPATSRDVHDLHKMLTKSIGNEALSASSLRNELFSPAQLHETGLMIRKASIELDLSLLEPQRPLTQALVAEINGQLIGCIIFHYYFTPWVGHCAFISKLFVENHMHNVDRDYHLRSPSSIEGQIKTSKDTTKLLLAEVISAAREKNLKMLLFNLADSSLIRSALGEDFRIVRGPETDWSVLRIQFE